MIENKPKLIIIEGRNCIWEKFFIKGIKRTNASYYVNGFKFNRKR